jgi:hypothetical protein
MPPLISDSSSSGETSGFSSSSSNSHVHVTIETSSYALYTTITLSPSCSPYPTGFSQTPSFIRQRSLPAAGPIAHPPPQEHPLQVQPHSPPMHRQIHPTLGTVSGSGSFLLSWWDFWCSAVSYAAAENVVLHLKFTRYRSFRYSLLP